MKHDPLSDALSIIKNAEKVGKKECIVPASNLIREVLKVMQRHGYIGAFEFIDDGRSGKFKVELKNVINDTNTIKPRYPVGIDEFERWEKRYLPAAGFGILILTTDKGVMSHEEAKKKKIGGRLLAFVY
ncbi:MAG: 30S ribosomal protein S8 [Candidatus Aenigmarchaeota archaeon]|nr:30S ribosomal protein S8 [Candidatus Aenigmarchaeota archaeon]